MVLARTIDDNELTDEICTAARSAAFKMIEKKIAETQYIEEVKQLFIMPITICHNLGINYLVPEKTILSWIDRISKAIEKVDLSKVKEVDKKLSRELCDLQVPVILEIIKEFEKDQLIDITVEATIK